MSNVLDLNTLDQISEINPDKLKNFADHCSVMLDRSNHKSGVMLTSTINLFDNMCEEENPVNFSIPSNTNGFEDNDDNKNFGALAITFLLVKKYTEFRVYSQSIKGTGIDYWLCFDKSHPKYQPTNFLNARLEVSGIGKESPTNNFNTRLNSKTKQVTKSHFTGLPCFIGLVEFSTPKAILHQEA